MKIGNMSMQDIQAYTQYPQLESVENRYLITKSGIYFIVVQAPRTDLPAGSGLYRKMTKAVLKQINPEGGRLGNISLLVPGLLAILQQRPYLRPWSIVRCVYATSAWFSRYWFFRLFLLSCAYFWYIIMSRMINTNPLFLCDALWTTEKAHGVFGP